MLLLNPFKLISGTFTRYWLVEGGIQKNFQKIENCPSWLTFHYVTTSVSLKYSLMDYATYIPDYQHRGIWFKSTNKRQVNMILSRPRKNPSKLLERNLPLVGSHKEGIERTSWHKHVRHSTLSPVSSYHYASKLLFH